MWHLQVLNLKEGELHWLAKHLGHELNIHKAFYQLHESNIEMSKVTKLLLAVDKGNISAYANMSLDNITLDVDGKNSFIYLFIFEFLVFLWQLTFCR